MKSIVKKLVVLETNTILWYACDYTGYTVHNPEYFCSDVVPWSYRHKHMYTHTMTSTQIDSTYFDLKDMKLESIYSIHLVNWYK